MNDSPIFRSIQQALTFSYGAIVSVPRLKCGTRLSLIAIIESAGAITRVQAAFLSYLYGEGSSINFEGLSGTERMATCAMVVAAVADHLPTYEAYAIWTRHGWGAYRQAGAVRLARHLHVRLGVPYDAMRMLLAEQSLPRKDREAGRTFKGISDKTEVPIRTLERAAQRMRPILRGLENAGYDRLSPMFERDGLIPAVHQDFYQSG